MSSNVSKCPKCNCTEIGQGKLTGHAAMMVVGKIFAGSAIIADVCTGCGYVIQFKVEKPYKFKK